MFVYVLKLLLNVFICLGVTVECLCSEVTAECFFLSWITVGIRMYYLLLCQVS